MVHISQLLDEDKLKAEVAAGTIAARIHPEYYHGTPYTIYSYTDAAQFKNEWTHEQRVCRGLIVDDEGNVIARPWEKFFNLGQMKLGIQMDDDVEVMDKVDGSLGILYPEPVQTKFNGGNLMQVQHYAIATRGSFVSEQAFEASDIWDEKYAGYVAKPVGFTFLFEIVYPENRILLNYGDMRDLVLLGAVNIDYGYYLGPTEAAAVLSWPGPVVDILPHKTISDALGDTSRDNAEGFVVRKGSYMVKIKQPDYVELHKLRFDLTPRRIWEKLMEGYDMEYIVAPLPDEFQQEVLEIAKKIELEYQILDKVIRQDYKVLAAGAPSRKHFATRAKDANHSRAMFLLYDDKDISEYVWKQIRP